MPGETELANHALSLIGATRIEDLTEGTDKANTVNNIYTALRDSLIRKGNWDWATKRVKLARSSTAPAFEYDYAYPLEHDWLRTVAVHGNDAGYGTIDYRTEFVGTQRCIVTSSENVYMRYICRVTDAGLFSADFYTALVVALARDLSIPIASSNTMRKEYKDDAKRSIAAARSTDSIDSSPERRPRGSWANSRGGGRGNDRMDND